MSSRNATEALTPPWRHAPLSKQLRRYSVNVGNVDTVVGPSLCNANPLKSIEQALERLVGTYFQFKGFQKKERIKALEREVRELRQANEILRKASAYFAQAELDRPFKK